MSDSASHEKVLRKPCPVSNSQLLVQNFHIRTDFSQEALYLKWTKPLSPQDWVYAPRCSSTCPHFHNRRKIRLLFFSCQDLCECELMRIFRGKSIKETNGQLSGLALKSTCVLDYDLEMGGAVVSNGLNVRNQICLKKILLRLRADLWPLLQIIKSIDDND